MLPILLALTAAAAPPTAKRPDAAQSLVQSCDAHKFETLIEVPGPDGAIKHSRVKLCGNEGQSDADWVRTLKDAVAKTQANTEMPASVREQIITAVNAEIARIESPSKVGLLPPIKGLGSASSPLADYGALPPLPSGPSPSSLPPPRSAAQSAPSDFAALPPMPDTPPPPVHVLPGASAALPALPRPKLSFACFTPGEGGEGPCTDFTRDTLVVVRADEDLPAGTSLRFVARGNEPADVELAQLKRGRTMRFALPSAVCRGMTNGSLEIRIVRSVPAAGSSGQEVGQEGPYALRC
jgi:hypothetical protein